MTYKIKIDRSSIKENPNAGSTVLYVPGRVEWYKTEYKDGIVSEYAISEDESVSYLTSQRSRIAGDPPDGTVKTRYNQPVYTIHLLSPIGKYNFRYEKQDIQCDYCKRTFDYTLLKSSDYDDDDYGSFSDRVCPFCDEFDCCDIVYERIDEIIK